MLDIGHISAAEAIKLLTLARECGVKRVLVPANHFDNATIKTVCSLEAYVEFSFFFVSLATQAALTRVDVEKHTVLSVKAQHMAKLIHNAPINQVILSSDCGVYLLPTPIEGLRKFLQLLCGCGLAAVSLSRMVRDNLLELFGLTAPSSGGIDTKQHASTATDSMQ